MSCGSTKANTTDVAKNVVHDGNFSDPLIVGCVINQSTQRVVRCCRVVVMRGYIFHVELLMQDATPPFVTCRI
jgi:hypothetical protein